MPSFITLSDIRIETLTIFSPLCGRFPYTPPPAMREDPLPTSPPVYGRGLRGGQQKPHLLFPVESPLSAPSFILPRKAGEEIER